jgi:archaellum component FlaC
MSILANKFGSDAASLSVISEHFSGLANQIENQLVTFSKFTGNLLKAIERCSLDLIALKTQMNMVDFFVKESMSKNMFDEMISNKDIFSALFAHSSENLLKETSKLTSEAITIEGQIAEIQKFINGLEIVKQTGAIESARKDNVKAAFGVYLQEMNAFTAILRDSIDKLSKARTNLYYNANEIQDSTRGMRDNVEDLFKLVMQRNKVAA